MPEIAFIVRSMIANSSCQGRRRCNIAMVSDENRIGVCARDRSAQTKDSLRQFGKRQPQE